MNLFKCITQIFKKETEKFAVTNAGLVFRVEQHEGNTYRLSKGRFEFDKRVKKLKWVKGNFEEITLTRKQIKKFVSAEEAEQLLTNMD